MKRLLLPMSVAALLVAGCPQEKKHDDHGDHSGHSHASPAASPAAMTQGTGAAGTTATSTTSASIDLHPDATARKVKVGVKFEPAIIVTKKGQPLALEFTRTTEKTCATEVIFDGGPLKGQKIDLPVNQPVRVSFTPDADGDIVFGCNMGRMIAGKLRVSS